MKHIESTISALLNAEARKAIRYISERQIVRASRRLSRGRIDKRGNIEVALTIGRPNYEERKAIRAFKRAGARFPVKKLALKFPKRKNR
jgi:hypothetical protein